MIVLVAAVGQPDCPAARALLTEGVECEVVVMDSECDYADALIALWQRGEELCVIEHDVIPWPGALAALSGCSSAWCVYPYHFAPNKLRYALGCLRVSRELVQAHQDLPQAWEGVAWNALDGAVYRALRAQQREPHVHEPGFAHARPHDVLVVP